MDSLIENNHELQSLTGHIIHNSVPSDTSTYDIPEVEVSVSDWHEAPGRDQRVVSGFHEVVRIHKQAVVVHPISGTHSVQVPEHIACEAHRSGRVRSGLQAYN